MGNKVNKPVKRDPGDIDIDDLKPQSGMLNTNMLRLRDGDVEKKYEILKLIGEGSMGSISKAVIRDERVGGSAYDPTFDAKKKRNVLDQVFNKSSSGSDARSSLSETERRDQRVVYALKTIVLSRVSEAFIEELRNEIDILRTLDHPNIVKAYEVFENRKKNQIYIVMDLNSGGDLYKRGPYSEKESAKIIGQLLSAIKYMHDKGIVHRDLKFENIMFESKAKDALVKVIDFGLSKKFLPNEHRVMTEGVGTIYTMAPQVLQGVYTSQADLWSIGVISFMLLGSQKPFYHKRKRRVIDKIMRCDYKFAGPIWKLVSEEAKDFIANLLVIDPVKRMNAAQALAHPWLENQFKLSDRRPDESVMKEVEFNLLSFKDESEFKRVALNVIAHKSSAEELVGLRKAFDQYDSGNDGRITFEEFKLALGQSNLSQEEIASIFDTVDVNKNGHIMYTEFLAATLGVHGSIEEERIAEAFDHIDSDDTGYISKANLVKLLGKEASKERIEAILKEADVDGDGKISFSEFRDLFRKNNSSMARRLQTLDSSASTISSASIVDRPLLGLDAKIPGGKHEHGQMA